MDAEKCYLYDPSNLDRIVTRKRPRYVRSVPARDPSAQLRRRIYHDLWNPLKARIESVLDGVDQEVITDILNFLTNSTAKYWAKSLIPTCLIVTGPNLTYQNAFFDRIFNSIRSEKRSLLILLESGACSNLKNLLKEVTRQARTADEVARDEDVDDGRRDVEDSVPRLFDYDLEWVRRRHEKEQFEHVIVAVRDSEAFDTATLAQAVDLFHLWLNRIPFVLFFGIGVSTEFFQQSIPTSTLRHIRGEEFDVSQADEVMEDVFRAVVNRSENRVALGPALTTRLMIKTRDHFQSTDALSNGLQYAYMTHFYGSRLSVLLAPVLDFAEVPENVFEGVRNLPSYRTWAEAQLDAGETSLVQQSLESNPGLFDLVRDKINLGLSKIRKLILAVQFLDAIHSIIQPSQNEMTFASYYIMALNSELAGSPFLRESLLHIKKLSSEMLEKVLETGASTAPDGSRTDFASYRISLQELSRSAEAAGQPLKSQNDIRASTLRTTVVSQKIELSKTKSSLSKYDAQYSEILESFHNDLERYLQESLVNPQDLTFHEIFLYDIKSQTDAFTARPRYVIERALSTPMDYLGCNCCTNEDKGEDEENQRSISNQPATAILYQLYMESGALINVADLWTAYQVMIGSPEDEAELTKATALFQRGLAELSYFGMIKSTRRKTDHVAKVMWKGL